ncbi:O-antigen ligase [Lachnospiraceae bacterium PM6-15]|uniref:O-antigen ligase family protein n=1 Tax=Ohessyouella blattaphilus TaxID=2949333 RepID=UPI003E23F547
MNNIDYGVSRATLRVHAKLTVRPFQSLLKILATLLIICIPAEPLFPFMVRWLLIVFGLVLTVVLNKRFLITSYFKFQMIFLLLMIASLLYSPKGANGFGIIQSYFRGILHAYTIILLSIYIKKEAEDIIRYILNNFVLGTIIILLYTIVIERERILGSLGYWRIGRIVFAENGTFMVLSYSIIVSLLWTGFNLLELKKYRYIYFFTSLFLLVCAVLSGTKKTVLAVFVALVIYVLTKYRKQALRLVIRILLVGVLIVLLYLLMLNVDFLYIRIGYRIEDFIMATQGLDTGTISTTMRFSMIKYGFHLFADSPIIGKGVSAFRAYYYSYSGEYLYSHCNYVEMLCNQGLLGFSLYYGYLLWLLRAVVKKYSSQNEYFYMFFIIFLVVLMVLDYGQVSYYRVHYTLIIHVTSLAVELDKGKRIQEKKVAIR